MAPLADRSVIVTGASRGIGRAIVSAMAGAGALVYAAARSRDALDRAAAEAPGPGRVVPVPTDVTDPGQVAALVKRVEDEHGHVDILVNNAGVGYYAPVEELAVEHWDHMMDTNLKGAFLCCRAVLPKMKARQDGLIINIASVAGLTTFPGGAGYCASKWGMVALTETLREELRPFEVRACVVCPGSVQTDFAGTPPKPYALRPEDVAATVLHIAQAPRSVIINQVVMRPLVPREYQ